MRPSIRRIRNPARHPAAACRGRNIPSDLRTLRCMHPVCYEMSPSVLLRRIHHLWPASICPALMHNLRLSPFRIITDSAEKSVIRYFQVNEPSMLAEDQRHKCCFICWYLTNFFSETSDSLWAVVTGLVHLIPSLWTVWWRGSLNDDVRR